MYRFAFMTWDASNPIQCEVARALRSDLRRFDADWTTVLDREGLLVQHAAPQQGSWRAYPLPEKCGAVLGTLFRRRSPGEGGLPLDALDEREASRIIETDGKSLIDQFWGRYVAIIRDKRSHRRHFVLRDPCGQLPCHHARIWGVHLYFSDPSFLARSTQFRPEFDLLFLAANIMVPELAARRTGLCGVEEILPGECQEVDDNRVKKIGRWSPGQVVRAASIDEPGRAGAILRETVSSCVSAWYACYRKVIHNLSGGLDSSIVLACLARAGAPSQILCANYRPADTEGDERYFARLAAQAAGCELLEFEMPASGSLASMLAAHPHTLTTSGAIFGHASKSHERKIALDHGAEAFTSGEGGDHLFYQMKTSLVAADAARKHGFGPQTLKTAFEAATWTGQPLWSVLAQAFSYGFLRRRRAVGENYDPSRFPYLDRDLTHAARHMLVAHPWESEAASLPPGKAYQIHVLAKIFRRQEVSPRSAVADVVHPLLSQPVIECALQIPSYVLTAGGECRALARKAFEGLVPAEVLSRTSKGGTTGHFVRLVLDNLEEARELLCDGLLVARRIAHRAELEDCLSPARLQRPGEIVTVLKLLSTEAWMRTWAGSEFSG